MVMEDGTALWAGLGEMVALGRWAHHGLLKLAERYSMLLNNIEHTLPWLVLASRRRLGTRRALRLIRLG